MSKSYKKKRIEEEVLNEEVTLSKKEQYDLEKQKKLEMREKNTKKKNNSKKKKNHQTNLGSRIFAIIMLVLMIGSVIASVAAYLQ